MIYQRLAKVFLICSDTSIIVVSAKAGTHNHRLRVRARSCKAMSAPTYCVYILASRRHGTLYIGIINNLRTRLEQHRSGKGSEFVKKYSVHHLVHGETVASAQEAIAREKQLKNWHRDWKIQLIEKENPDWSDLSHLL
jgi:putative endonuclease